MCWFLPQERAQDSSVKEKKKHCEWKQIKGQTLLTACPSANHLLQLKTTVSEKLAMKRHGYRYFCELPFQRQHLTKDCRSQCTGICSII